MRNTMKTLLKRAAVTTAAFAAIGSAAAVLSAAADAATAAPAVSHSFQVAQHPDWWCGYAYGCHHWGGYPYYGGGYYHHWWHHWGR